jgi:hypothetical protein
MTKLHPQSHSHDVAFWLAGCTPPPPLATSLRPHPFPPVQAAGRIFGLASTPDGAALLATSSEAGLSGAAALGRLWRGGDGQALPLTPLGRPVGGALSSSGSGLVPGGLAVAAVAAGLTRAVAASGGSVLVWALGGGVRASAYPPGTGPAAGAGQFAESIPGAGGGGGGGKWV